MFVQQIESDSSNSYYIAKIGGMGELRASRGAADAGRYFFNSLRDCTTQEDLFFV